MEIVNDKGNTCHAYESSWKCLDYNFFSPLMMYTKVAYPFQNLGITNSNGMNLLVFTDQMQDRRYQVLLVHSIIQFNVDYIL